MKKKAKAVFPVSVTARMNDRAQPIDRGELYEDPLHDLIQAAGIGEVTGGGTQLSDTGEIEFCDIEIQARDSDRTTLATIMEMLEKLGAPKGSRLILNGQEDIHFGKLEGLAIYLNGTDLPDSVYQESDSNHVHSEFNRLLNGIGKIHSTWQGNTETAFYMYGTSFEEMRSRIADFVTSYPLCQKSRTISLT